MKKIVLLSLLCLFLWADATQEFDDMKSEDVEKIMILIEEKAKETLPIQLDRLTQLVGVIAKKNTLEYRNKINTNNQTIAKMLKEGLDDVVEDTFDSNRKDLCRNEDTRYIMSKGGIFIYLFFDIKDEELFRFTVDIMDCK
ncbi:MAG: hypothetical protein PHN38_07105 [Sulfurospirillaceae bacterium]|nr:hypothetical protein [Sulfurospirillaceae bacterium]MDD3463647.1 hypothetical protein [Sulfurospirillaceae bacterium]